MADTKRKLVLRDQRASILESVRVGKRYLRGLKRRVLREYRTGRDPLVPVQDATGLAALLLQQMMRSHLKGSIRALKIMGLTLDADATSLAHKEAVESLESRLGLTADGKEALEELYSPRVTQVTSGLSNHLEKKLARAMVLIQEQGLHVKAGVERLASAFDLAGLDPRSPNALEAIFRTNSQLAYSSGAWQADQHPAVQDILWGYEYTAVGDDRTRATHQAMDGVILEKNHPFWAENYPPNGWNCRCIAIPVTFDEKPKEQKEPPATVIVGEGEKQKVLPVRADKDFQFHPGRAFRDARVLTSSTSAAASDLIGTPTRSVSVVRPTKGNLTREGKNLGFKTHTDFGLTDLQKERMAESVKLAHDNMMALPNWDKRKPTKPMHLRIRNTNIPNKKESVMGVYSSLRSSIDIKVFDAEKRGWKGALTTGKRPPTWNVDKSVEGVLRHEYGHAVYFDPSQKAMRSEWERLWEKKLSHDDKRLISKYGSTQGKEGFAEAFAAYSHPEYGKSANRLTLPIERFFVEKFGKVPGARG